MLRRALFPAFLALAVAAVAFWPGPSQGQTEPSEDRTVVAAFFSSNFCAACRILEPRLADVLPDYEDRPIDYVKLNQTFSVVTGGRIRDLAERHGVGELYDDLKGATGLVALVDPRDGQVIEIITVDYGRENIRDAFDRALMTVNAREIG
ncbi:MAG: hypothetical protein PVI23_00300 [Maricaulaceae bacterium]|jgi:thiol-disulfide isomerase/thioredoxin